MAYMQPLGTGFQPDKCSRKAHLSFIAQLWNTKKAKSIFGCPFVPLSLSFSLSLTASLCPCRPQRDYAIKDSFKSLYHSSAFSEILFWILFKYRITDYRTEILTNYQKILIKKKKKNWGQTSSHGIISTVLGQGMGTRAWAVGAKADEWWGPDYTAIPSIPNMLCSKCTGVLRGKQCGEVKTQARGTLGAAVLVTDTGGGCAEAAWRV